MSKILILPINIDNIIKKEDMMLILNINGPINAGKTTVSKLLVQNLPNAVFIEVDDLLTETEQNAMQLSIQEGWAERIKRLNRKLETYKISRQYETIIFAYPITDDTYQKWSSMADNETRFFNVTLAPSLENCLKNRGVRQLTSWEENRIKQMYDEGYHKRIYADLIINNDNQTPDETAHIIQQFIAHIQNP